MSATIQTASHKLRSSDARSWYREEWTEFADLVHGVRPDLAVKARANAMHSAYTRQSGLYSSDYLQLAYEGFEALGITDTATHRWGEQLRMRR